MLTPWALPWLHPEHLCALVSVSGGVHRSEALEFHNMLLGGANLSWDLCGQ